MRILYCLCLMCMAFTLPAVTPWKNLGKVSGPEVSRLLIPYFNSHILNQDSVTALKTLDSLLASARHSPKPHMEVTALSLKGVYYQSRMPRGFTRAEIYFQQAMETAHQYGLEVPETVARHNLGYVQCRGGNYNEGLKNLLAAESDMQRLGAENVPDYERHLYDRAKIYLDFGYYEKAEQYLRQSLKLTSSESMRQRIYNAFGIVYSEWGKEDKAEESLRSMLQSAKKNSDTVAIAAASTNLGIAYLNRGNASEARPLLEAGYALMAKWEGWHIQLVALQARAQLDIKENFLEKARPDLQKASVLLRKYQIHDLDAWHTYYQLRSNWHKKSGNFRQASLYQDSLADIKDSILQIRKTSQLANIETQLMAERYAMNIKLLQQGEKWQRTLRNIITIGAALVIALLLVWGYRFQKQQKRKHQHLEKEKREALERLGDLRKRVQSNNQIIEELRKKQSSRKPDQESLPDRKVVEQLHQTIILTEKDWQEFKQLFERAYPRFLQGLAVKHPSLTEAEIRLLALIKLNLSVNEMAAMLGILPQSVRKTRQRLMKKLGLEDPKALPAFLNGLR